VHKNWSGYSPKQKSYCWRIQDRAYEIPKAKHAHRTVMRKSTCRPNIIER